MGTSTNGILAYGYDLGGADEWKVTETGEYGELALDWFDEDGEDDFVEAAEKRLLAAAGFTETDWQVDGFYTRQREAKARLGVEFAFYCSGDYPMYVLAAQVITVYRGDAKLLDLAALAARPAEHGWDGKLSAALTTLGLTPKQTEPGWLLVSYWG